MVDGGTPGGSVLGPILGGSGTSSYRSSSVWTRQEEHYLKSIRMGTF
jgi:hypothetical protein